MNTDHTVAREWRRRRPDERFLSLEELHATLADRRDRSWSDVTPLRFVKVSAIDDDLLLETPRGVTSMTDWSFSQLCSITRLEGRDGAAGLPRAFLRALPTEKAADLVNYVLERQSGRVMTWATRGGRDVLRAITSPRYGRILDVDVVAAVMKATDGRGWKVPGTTRAGADGYDPDTPVTRENTTLYAGDRDIFIFLVQDRKPLIVGTLPDGRPDTMFRGVYVRNSEVGACTYELCSMYLRAVCANRILWGVENKKVVRIRHTANAPLRFIEEAITHFDEITLDDDEVVAGVSAAKSRVLVDNDDDAALRFKALGLSKQQFEVASIAYRLLEQKPIRTAWDFSQAISSLAHIESNADERLAIEKIASSFLN